MLHTLNTTKTAFYNGWDGIETIIISDSPEVLDFTALKGVNDLYLGSIRHDAMQKLVFGERLGFYPLFGILPPF